MLSPHCQIHWSPASDAIGTEVLAAMGVTAGAVGSGIAAASGGVGGCPMNLGVASEAGTTGVKMESKSVAVVSAGRLCGSAARDWMVPSGRTSTGGICDLPSSAAVGLLAAVGTTEWLGWRA